MKKKFDEVREKLGELVCDSTQKAMAITLVDKDEGIPGALHLACNTALSALICAVPIVAKKPQLTEQEIKEKGQEVIVKAINYETTLFATLVASRMFGGMKFVRNIDDGDRQGLEVAQEVNFSLMVLSDALEDWKKLTGKNPDEYLDTNLLKSINQMEAESKAPFDEFLAKRINSPTSKTIN